MSILKIFEVNANRITGEWKGEPRNTGETTTAEEWARIENTDPLHLHFDIWDDGEELRAIRINWTTGDLNDSRLK